eukprot:362496-Chlamydomonas_euryale.AAC.1
MMLACMAQEVHWVGPHPSHTFPPNSTFTHPTPTEAVAGTGTLTLWDPLKITPSASSPCGGHVRWVLYGNEFQSFGCKFSLRIAWPEGLSAAAGRALDRQALQEDIE